MTHVHKNYQNDLGHSRHNLRKVNDGMLDPNLFIDWLSKYG